MVLTLQIESFIRDLGLIIELTKGSIYRSMGIPHPTHLFTEVLKRLPSNKYSEDHVAEVLEMLELLEEVDDDDEPELE